jgi:hypothetical protein
MKLLQNTAGNFFNMTPQEARTLAAKPLKAADDGEKAKPGRGAGFVQTIVLQEHRLQDMERRMSAEDIDIGDRYYGELDTIFVGISPTHIDVHPNLIAAVQLRSPTP